MASNNQFNANDEPTNNYMEYENIHENDSNMDVYYLLVIMISKFLMEIQATCDVADAHLLLVVDGFKRLMEAFVATFKVNTYHIMNCTSPQENHIPLIIFSLLLMLIFP